MNISSLNFRINFIQKLIKRGSFNSPLIVKKTILFQVLCLVLFSIVGMTNINGQCPTLFVDDLHGTPGYPEVDDLSVCGKPDTISLYVLNTSGQTLLNSELVLKIPSGMQYGGCAEAFDPAYDIKEGDVSDLQNPTFIFESIGADSVQIVSICVIANCEIYDNSPTQQYFFDADFNFLFLPDGSNLPIQCMAMMNGQTDYSPIIKRPTINITRQSRQNVVISNASRVCNDVRVQQTGIGASVAGFNFTIDGLNLSNFGLNELSIGGVSIPYVYDASTLMLSSFVDASYLPGGALGEDEFVDVRVCYDAPLVCDTDQAISTVTYGASFGCSPDEPPCVDPSTTDGSIKYTPNFGANAVVDITQVASPGICGSNAIFDAVVNSANPDPVLGLWEEVKIGFQICEGDVFDAADVKINGESLPAGSYYYENFDFVVDATTFNFDPDGPGGFEDLDGDGIFDEIPGGNTVTMTIEVSVKCQDPAAIAGCASIDCEFSQATVSGLRHCGQTFQSTPQIDPAPSFSYGSEYITIDEGDISSAQNGSLLGYDFMNSTGSNDGNISTNTVEMEFCYQYLAEGIDACSAAGDDPYFEIAVDGPPIVIKDMVINDSSVTFNGAGVPSGNVSTAFNMDSTGVVFKILAGSNDATIDQCYKWTLELDSCVCYPKQLFAASMRVVETCSDCMGPDGNDCTLVRACESTILAARRSCQCICPMSSKVVEQRRVEFGYTDKSEATAHDESTVNTIDWNRYLPCDSVYMHVEYEVLDELAMNDLDEIYFRIYNYALGGGGPWAGRPAWELEPDMHNSKMVDFAYEKVGSGVENTIDFTGCNTDNRSLYYRNINDGYLDAQGFLPTGVIDGVSTYNSTWDVLDNREFNFGIHDRGRQVSDGGATHGIEGNCWEYLREDLMGGLQKGDKFHLKVKIPLQKNPFRLLLEEAQAIAPPVVAFHPNAYWYKYAGGKRGYVGGTCTTPTTIETHCPGPIVSETEYNVTDCDATVEHSFVMTNTPDDWYVGEWRSDILEFDTLLVPIPSPMVYAGNPRIMMADGTIIPISDPTFDNNTFCAFDASDGQNKCTSISGGTGYMSFDVSEIPNFGVGLGGVECSFKLLYDLERICPGPIASPEDFAIYYDYSQTCDYVPGGHYCNRTQLDTRPDLSFFGQATAPDLNSRLPCNPRPQFSDRDYHIVEDTSFTLDFNNMANPLPALNSSIESGLMADAAGASEFNTYEVCAGSGAIPHENVMTTIFLEPTVDLINVTDNMGASVTYTLTNQSALGNTYLIAHANDLAPGDCVEYTIETELKICPYPGVGTRVSVKTTSSCLDLEFASQLFGVGGDACVSTGQQYEYIAGESEVQAEWDPQMNPIPLCGIAMHSVLVKNTKDATLVDLEFNFNFPNGLSVIPGTFEYEYPEGAGNWTTISDPTPNGNNIFGTVFSLNDDDMVADINSMGLPGILDMTPNANRLKIRFQSRTDCDEYVSNTPIYFETTAATPCEESISTGFTKNDGVLVENAIPADNAQFLIVADPLDYSCGGPVPLTVAGTNLSETGGETFMSEACFKFPMELAYTPSSFNFLTPSSWTPTYVNETPLPGGFTEVCFDLPDGIKPFESFAFEAEITPDPDAGCEELLMGANVKSLVEDQVCVGDDNIEGNADDTICDVFVNNSINDQLVVNIKAPVEATEIEMVVQCDEDPTMAIFDYTLTLEATVLDYVGPLTVDFYRDLNLNGVLDPGIDVLMDTQMHNVNVTAGQEAMVTGTTTVLEEFSCPILLDLTFDVDCECNSGSYLYEGPPTPDFADVDGPISLCPGDDLMLDICSGYNYELANPASAVLTETADMLTVAVNDGFGINSPVVLKVSNTSGTCPGEWEIEIFQLETFEIGPFPTVDACDMDCTELALPGVPDDWKETMTVTWSPDTYLDDANSWEPEICNPVADIDYTVTVFNPNTGCTASATYFINVIETTPPTLTYEGFEECYFAYEPAKIIAEPAGQVNYKFYFEDPAGDILLQNGADNEFILPFPAGTFYVVVDDGQCETPSAPLTIDLKFCTFDLALRKVLRSTQSVPVYLNDIVIFDITVFNQGTETSQDMQVTDYIPAGFELMDPNWFSVSATEANITIPGPLLAGQMTTISIMLKVTDTAAAGVAINDAEISSADDINSRGYPDIDSDEDNDNTNDAGGTPDTAGEDNEVNDDGAIDEDDHDPASVPVAIFDLALIKELSPTQTVPVTIGSMVTYDITVCNQGSVDAYNIQVVDNIPAGMSLANPADPDWVPGAMGVYRTIPGPLTPNNCTPVQLVLKVDALPPSGSFTNFAEISQAEDSDGNMPDDIDSTADDDNTNDGPFTDDDFGSTNGDEDDHDPAFITVVQTECTISNNAPICPGETLVLEEIGTGNMTWSWSGPQGFSATTQTVTITPGVAGLYTVTVTGVDPTIEKVCDFNVIIHPELEISGVVTDVACAGADDGMVDLTVTVGDAPYSYDWSNDGPEVPDNDVADITGLAPGDYIVTVTDANGCSKEAEFTIAEPAGLTCMVAGTDLDCNGDNSGTVTVTAMGGTLPLEYSLNGGAYQPGNMFSGLAAGNQMISVRDANDCISTCEIIITEPDALSCTLVATNDTSCDTDNGSLEVQVTGGTTGYEYSLDGVTYQMLSVFNDLAAGDYIVTTRDANGCTTTCEASLTSPELPFCNITAFSDITCNGATDGSLIADGFLGSGVYEFSIDGGVTWQADGEFIDLGAGTYVVDVRDFNFPDCTSDCTVTLEEPTLLECELTGEDISCEGVDDGEITVSATGSTGDYEYSIDMGMTWQIANTFTDLAAGMYTVQTRDLTNNICFTSCTITLTEPTALTCSLATSMVMCNGDDTGGVTVTALGGTSPYEYSLDGAPYQPGNQFMGQTAGSYTVTVRDANDCLTTCTATITEPTELSCDLMSTDATNCNVEDGTITVTGTGGTTPYLYSIDGMPYQASAMFTGLMAGTHLVSIQDANECTSTCEATIEAPGTPMCQIISITDVECFGESTGGVTVIGSGPNSPFEFSLDEIAWQANGVFTGLPAGMTTIYVRNVSSPSCTSTCTVDISQPEEIQCLLTGNDPLCNGGDDGNITTIATEGTPPFEYSLDGGAYQPGHVFMDLTAGLYEVTIRDDNGCLKTCDVTLGEPTEVTCTTAVVDLPCNGDESGMITITGAGGTPPYDYNLDNGFWQDGNVFTGLSGGTYTVYVRDDNDCVSTCEATVVEPPLLTCTLVEVIPESCVFDDGSIEVSGAGGTGTLSYSLDGGAAQATGLFEGLTLGVYTITITDDNDCIATCEYEVLPDCFDLALVKTLSTPGPYSYGQKIVFDIEVINQGNIDATDVEVTEHIPCGFEYDPSSLINLSNDWTTFPTSFPMSVITSLAAQSSETLQIELTILECTDPGGHVNVSEISEAFDPDGDEIDDEDSTPDYNPDNDAGGDPYGPSNDQEDGDGTDDEDDHDVELVPIYDLALTKMLVTPEPYAYGDLLEFALEVCNQASNPVQNITISDYVPVGYSYDLADNPGWSGTGATPTTLQYTYETPLLAGAECVTIPLFLTLEMAGGTDDWKNVGEISSFEDQNGDPQDDVDSTPDNDPDNDGDMEDDATDGTNGDEDDSDFAGPTIVDAALVKTTTATGPFSYGDMVTFDFEVSNQGNVALQNVVINDFIPCGYLYLPVNTPLWTYDSATGIANTTVVGPIAPGASETLSITLEVQPCPGTPTGAWTNVAEIQSMEDEDGMDVTDEDIDSTADDDPTNDPTDDNTDDNSNGDEDDSDPETIEVFDLAQKKMIVTAGPYAYGDLLEYSITLTNQGNVTAQNIMITDHLPAGFTFDLADNTGWDDSTAPAYTYIHAGPLLSGETVNISIFVTIQETSGGDENYTNISEISGAVDEDGLPRDDADSTADDDPNNDGDPIDDETEDQNDEDDHDPEVIEVIDAALVKTTTATGPFSYGDMVTFDFEVSNQGNVALQNVVINDFIPCGYLYLPVNAPLWTYDSATGIANTTVVGPIAPGTSETLSITLEVQPCPGTPTGAWTNVAEIQSMEDEDGMDVTDQDIDSTADDDPTNDPTDDNTDDNSNGDEDDSDLETIEIFDLAQKKMLATPLPYTYGDLLEYTITLINQGNVSAQNIEITDHLPAGFTFDSTENPGWDDTLAPAYTFEHVGPLMSGESVEISIFVTLVETSGGSESYTNTSEISAAEDEDGMPRDDADSTADGDPDNDGDSIDDATEDPDDEDDHDTEVVALVDAALRKNIVTPGPYAYGDIVTFNIELINQGVFALYDLKVNDFIPCGFEYLASNDAVWSYDSATGIATSTLPTPLLGGTTEILTIDLELVNCSPSTEDAWSNVAEIESFRNEDGDDITDQDIDSDGDDDPTNDNTTDDEVDNGDDDEDDNDIAVIEIFDLALTKTIITPGPYAIDQQIVFELTVFNQGSIAATDVQVVDYLPVGFTFDPADNPNWVLAAAQTYSTVLLGPIAPGTSMSIQIIVTINDSGVAGTEDYANYGEIASASDEMGNPAEDVDSTADDVNGNDAGAEAGEDTDDFIDGDGTDDEDDHDIAFVDLLICHDLACIDAINVSLDENCEALITGGMMLNDAPLPNSYYIVTLKDEYGNVVPNPVGQDYLGMTITASVSIDGCDDTSCWGNVTIEDKLLPSLELEPICFVECNALYLPDGSVEIPVVDSDNCGGAEVIWLGDVPDPNFDCEDPIYDGFSGVFIRSFAVVDAAMNTDGTVYTKEVWVRRPDLTGITFPENVDIQCTESTDPSNTGYPEICDAITGECNPLIPNEPNDLCNVFLTFTDSAPIPTKCNNFTIMRTWRLVEWFCGAEYLAPTTFPQVITVTDNEGPVLNELLDVTVSTIDDCSVDYALPIIEATDDCNGIKSYLINTGVNPVFTNSGETVTFTHDANNVDGTVYTIEYVVSDECHNTSTETFELTVIDDRGPIAICEFETQVDLSGSGFTHVYADFLDDGSFDDCGYVHFEVRRMTDNCGKPENLEFGDHVSFCCADKGTEQMVVFKVTDGAGNSNICMVTVIINNKDETIFTIPDDVVLTAEECAAKDLDDIQAFGPVRVQDECFECIDLDCVTVEESESVFECNTEVYTRTYTLTRPNADPIVMSHTVTCIGEGFDFDGIVWPASLIEITDPSVGGCLGNISPDELMSEPILNAGPLDQLAVNFVDQVLEPVPGAGDDFYKKIVRTWTVLDWCATDNSEIVSETYVQTIKLLNAPFDACVATLDVDLDSGCQATIPAPFNVFPGCVTYTIDGGDINFLQSGTSITLSLTEGMHTIVWSATNLFEQDDQSCTTVVTVSDPLGICPLMITQNRIQGHIHTEMNLDVKDIEVRLMGTNDMVVTDTDGNYDFGYMTSGSAYEVEPFSDVEHRNGVSTLDILIIQRHLLNLQSLTTPYQYIAADANDSGDLSAADIVDIRKLILEVTDKFPSNTSWRFVDEDQVFIDPNNPFIQGLDETYQISQLISNMNANFVGVKIGDVNNSVVMSATGNDAEQRGAPISIGYSRSSSTLDLIANEGMELSGLQLELVFDQDVSEFTSELPGFEADNYVISGNTVKISYAAKTTLKLEKGQSLFEVNTESKSVSIGEDSLVSEIYTGESAIAIHSVQLENKNTGLYTPKMVNQPNPWSESTDIVIVTPISQTVDIVFTNELGQVIFTYSDYAHVGINRFTLTKESLNTTGVVFYTTQVGTETLKGTMLIIE